MATTPHRQQHEPQHGQPAQNRGAVAVIPPPRLPYPEGVQERFGIDNAGWKALVESVFPAAKTSGAVILALSYCKARRLDPFKRPVHIVPIRDAETGAWVESVWPGIGEHRTTAIRTGAFAGMDATVFGETITETFKDKVQVKGRQDWRTAEATVTFPSWAQVTVYRIVHGQRVAFPGPRVYWREYYARVGRSIIPNERWRQAPCQMLEKCAEAGALRRAFPEELGDDWTADEAGFFGATDPKDITPVGEPSAVPPEPTRAQFTDQGEDSGEGPPSGDTIDPGAGSPGDAPDDLFADAEPEGWPLYDAIGETVGTFGITEWLPELDRLLARMPAKDRRQCLDNNLPSARAMLADADTPEQLKATLRDRFQAFLPVAAK